VLKLGLGEEIRGKGQSLAEPNIDVHGDCAATVEGARDGGARYADVFGELGCGDGAEELPEQFAGLAGLWIVAMIDSYFTWKRAAHS